MSAASVEFHQKIIEKKIIIEKEEDGPDYFADLDERLPWFHEFSHALQGQVAARLQKAFYAWNGVSVTSIASFVEMTRETVAQESVPVLAKAYAGGLMIGRGNSDVVKSHGDDPLALISNDDFGFESGMLASMFCDDIDLVAEFNSILLRSENRLYHILNIEHLPQELKSKIWDLHALAVHATANACFVAGYEVGNDKKIQDTLDGIMRATEEK